MKGLLGFSGLAVVCAAALFAQTPQALVNQNCLGCHNDKLKSGNFSWTKLDPAHPEQNAEQAEKVIRKVKAGLMPPPGIPRDTVAMKAFAASLENSIDQAAALHPNPGRPALHRLNRTEYANSGSRPSISGRRRRCAAAYR